MEFLTQTPQVVSTIHQCLFGLQDLSICSYNPENPSNIYLSLGEAVAAFGLIFAVTQLQTPSWKLVLKIRKSWQRNLVWVFGGLGLLFAALAALTQQLYKVLPAPLNYPVFYELLSFIFFVLAPISLVYLGSSSRKLFTKNSAKDFYEVLGMEVARAKPETLEASVNIIGYNIDDIFRAVKRYHKSKVDKVDEDAKYASAILNVILSEKVVVDYLVTGRLDFLSLFIEKIPEHELYSNHIGGGFGRIVEALFYNRDSYFYKQLDDRGIAESLNIYDMIFSNVPLSINFTPLANWHPYSRYNARSFEAQDFAVFEKAFSISLKSLVADERRISTNSITEGLKQLKSYISSLTSIEDAKILNDRLYNVSSLLGHSFKFAVYKPNGNDIYDIGVEIALAYGEVVFDFVSTTSQLEDKLDEDFRTLNLFATGNILPDPEGEGFKPSADKFFELIWEAVENNVLRGWFPPVTKTYLRIIGLDNFGPGSRYRVERSKLIDFMEKELRPKLLAGQTMMNKKYIMEDVLLPKNVILNRETMKFEYITGSENHQVMNSDTPKSLMIISPNS